MLPLLAGAGRLLASGAGKKVADSASKKAAGTAAKKLSKDKFFNREEKQESDNIKTGMARPSISPTKLLPPSDIKDPPKKVDLSKGGEEGGIKDTFNKIDDTLNGIISSINRENQFRKKESEDSRKRAELENKQRQENKLERGGSRGIGPSIKLPGDGFGIGKFFKNILIGGLILAIMKNLQSIIEFFKKTYKQIKEFMEKLGEFLTPIWNGLKWIVGEGIKLVAKMLGIPAEDVDDKDILKNLNEISKKIPGLKQLFEGINKTIASLKSGSSNGGGGGGGGGGFRDIDASTIQVDTPEEKAFIATVRELEGTAGDQGYNTWFGGRTDMDLSKMTVSEVVAEQKRRIKSGEATYGEYTSAAVGAGQFMKPEETVRAMGLDPDKVKYTPELQNRMILFQSLAKRGIDPSKELTVADMQVLGNEWASFTPRYGQTTRTAAKSLETYKKNLQEAGKTTTPNLDIPFWDPGKKDYKTGDLVMKDGEVRKFDGMGWAAADGPSAQDLSVPPPTPAQVQAPAQSSAASSASAISESADYEMPGGVSGTMIMPMQSQGGSPTMSGGGGGGMMPVGISKKEVLNSLYQAQLVGFLYKQG
jgi:hypothetical protein